VNGLWGQQGFSFEKPYLDVLAEHHGAGLRTLDIASDPEGVRAALNAWVNGETAGLVPELFPSRSITPDTRLLLVNTLYFKGAWKLPFKVENTRAAPFQSLGGGTGSVEMMNTTAKLPFMAGDGFQAVALPYVGDALRMLVIVPDAGRFEEVEQRLSLDFLDTVRAQLKPGERRLGLPRFQVALGFSALAPLQSMGLRTLFTDGADLSGISQTGRLTVSSVFHRAVIIVDELGSEAAAATGVGVGVTSLPPETLVDRPFLFAIEDEETRSVLFLGRFVQP